MLKIAQLAGLLCWCSLLGWPSHAAEILIYGDDDYPPMMYKDAQGQARGIMADALRNDEQFSATKVTLQPTSCAVRINMAARAKGV